MSPSALVILLAGALLFATAAIAFLLAKRVASRPSPPEVRPRPEGTTAPAAAEAAPADTPAAKAAAASDGARAERMRNLLLARMSHDLRSPLNSVVTLSHLLLEGNVGALSIEQRRYVDVIRSSGQTLLALINDILDLAAVESGRVEIEVGAVELIALTEGVAGGAERLARDRGVPLHVNSSERQLVGRADEDRLRQIVQRLVEHAISETRNGYVEVTVERSADRRNALVRVHATGEGLSEAARRALSGDRRAFDDYLAGEGTFAERGPAALPLVVASRLATVMGLRLDVQSDTADGVSFELELPLAPAGELAPARPSPALGGAAQAPAYQRGGGSVLLIEDDLIERQRVAAELEAAGYEMTLASSGDEGLAMMRARHFDVVVLDLIMPGMSGLEVLRAARGDESIADIPFVVLSALTMTKGERAVLGPGVVGVVRKGDSTGEELVMTLRRAIKPQATEVRPGTGGDGSPHA
jgi:signal transduction histidine kinase